MTIDNPLLLSFCLSQEQMEQIQNELLQLRVSENKKDMRRSLMDIIGADRDTTATRPVITKISQS